MVQVNVNPAYRSNELRYALNLVGVKVLLMAEQFRTQNLPDILNELLIPSSSSADGDLVSSSQLPSLERVIMLTEQRPNPK